MAERQGAKGGAVGGLAAFWKGDEGMRGMKAKDAATIETGLPSQQDRGIRLPVAAGGEQHANIARRFQPLETVPGL